MSVTIKLRRGTSLEWTNSNPNVVLSLGEPGFETDTHKLKIGDGITAWNSLDYVSDGFSGVGGPLDYTYAVSYSANTFIANYDANDVINNLQINPTSHDIDFSAYYDDLIDNSYAINITLTQVEDADKAILFSCNNIVDLTSTPPYPYYSFDVIELSRSASFTGFENTKKYYLNIDIKGDSARFQISSVDLHNGGVQTAQVLQFDNNTLQSVITGPTPPSGNSSQRIIIQGQRAQGGGEGGDVYVWGGDSDANGGDIKIYAGDADNVSPNSGYGGYVNIDGGKGASGGGRVEITGGYSAGGQAGDVIIAGGPTSSGFAGDVDIGSNYGSWIFGSDGSLKLPRGGNWDLNNIITDETETVTLSGAGISAVNQMYRLQNEIGFYMGATNAFYRIEAKLAPATGYYVRLDTEAIGDYESEDLITWTNVIGEGVATTPPTGSVAPANITLAINTYDGTSGWTFGGDGSLTLPSGSIISETNNTLSLMPPTAVSGQSLVIRPTQTWSLTSNHPSGFAPGDSITITFTPNTGSVGSFAAAYTFTGCTEEQLGRSLTGSLVYTEEETQSLTWTIPSISNITSFTFTIQNVVFPQSADPFITLSSTGSVSNEPSHLHLIAGNPTTVDLFLGDDDQYVKIGKDGGDVVVGTNSDTNHWTFGTDASLTLPVNGSIICPSTPTYYVMANIDGNTVTSSDGLNWNGPYDLNMSINHVATNDITIVAIDGGDNIGYTPFSNPSAITSIPVEVFGITNISLSQIIYGGGYFVVAGNGIDGMKSVPLYGYSSDGSNWTFKIVEGELATTLASNNDENCSFSDIDYNGTGWNFAVVANNIGGGVYTTDITETFTNSNFFGMVAGQQVAWNGSSWYIINADAGSGFNPNVDPRINEWDGPYNPWGSSQEDLGIEITDDISDTFCGGNGYLVLSDSDGHISFSSDNGVNWTYKTPIPYTATITNISLVDNKYQLTLTGEYTSHANGEKITISGSSVTEYNGIYFLDDQDFLYTTFELITPWTPEPASFSGTADLTWSHGQYIDAMDYVNGYFYIGNDDEQIARSNDLINWTIVDDRNDAFDYWNDFSGYSSGGIGGLIINGNEIMFSDGSIQTTAPTVIDVVQGSGVSVTSSSGTFTVGVSGLNASYISDFSSSVSGLLPVKNVVQGSGINVTSSSGIFTVSTTQNDHGSLYGLADDDHLQYVHIDNTRTINAVHNFSNGLGINTASPSGALHIINDDIALYIGDYSSWTVGGKLRVFLDDDDSQDQAIKTMVSRSGLGTHYGVNGTSYTINGSGLGRNVGLYGYAGNGLKNWGLWIQAGQSILDDKVGIKNQNPAYDLDVTGSGNFSNSLYVSGVAVSVSGHSHTVSNISDFSSSVSGLLPVVDVVQGSGINVTSSSGTFTVGVSGLNASYISDFNSSVNDRVGDLLIAGDNIDLDYITDPASLTVSIDPTFLNTSLVAGSGISLDYANDELTVSVSGISSSYPIPTVVNLSVVSSTISTDASAGQIFNVALTSSATLSNPTNPIDGVTLRWRIQQDAYGSRTVTLGDKFQIPTSATSPLPFSTAPYTIDLLAATYNSATDRWDIIAFVMGY